MTDWKYLVPRYVGSAWAQPHELSTTSVDLDWPRVGIYCPHEPVPWLLGSFSVSAALHEWGGAQRWTWARDFVTGSGHVIRLGRKSDAEPFQSIVDDAPHDPEALYERLTQLDPMSEDAADILAGIERADASMRSRVAMKCGTCRLSRTFRMERVEPLLSTFWHAGIREIDLESFARRVDRMPSR